MADYLTSALNALKLPTYIIAGLFLAALLLLVFDYFALVNLMEIHPLARPGVIIATIVFGSLSFAAFVGAVYDSWKRRHKITLLARRRELHRAEAKRDLAELQAQVLKRLDYLSKEEVRHVADCLRKNQQSFLASGFSGHVHNLQAKGFVDSPGGTYHRDRVPYSFGDFVWEALLLRKEEFIAKDDAHKQQEEAERMEESRQRREMRQGRF
jgi:hypothetical protein